MLPKKLHRTLTNKKGCHGISLIESVNVSKILLVVIQFFKCRAYILCVCITLSNLISIFFDVSVFIERQKYIFMCHAYFSHIQPHITVSPESIQPEWR